MWKAMRCCAVWALAGAAVSAVAAPTLSSRYGTLSTKEVDFEQRIYFNGKPVPLATALYDLNISLNKKFQIGDKIKNTYIQNLAILSPAQL